MPCVARTCCSPSRQGLRVGRGGGFAIPKSLDKCSLIVNLVLVNREMPEKAEKFSLPLVKVLALLAHWAQQGSSFFLPPLVVVVVVGLDVCGTFGRC